MSWTPPTWGSFTFTAVATDASGNVSVNSAPVTVVAPYNSALPDVPTGVSTTFSGTQAVVNWSQSFSAWVQNTSILKSIDGGHTWATVATLSPGATSQTITGLTGSTDQIFFKVAANNPFGSSTPGELINNPFPTQVNLVSGLQVEAWSSNVDYDNFDIKEGQLYMRGAAVTTMNRCVVTYNPDSSNRVVYEWPKTSSGFMPIPAEVLYPQQTGPSNFTFSGQLIDPLSDGSFNLVMQPPSNLYFGQDAEFTATDGITEPVHYTFTTTWSYTVNTIDYYTSHTNISTVVNIVSGNHQTTSPEGAVAPQPLLVQVTDSNTGNVVTNAPITFKVVSGGGSLSHNHSGTILGPTINLMTDANGLAKVFYKQPAGVNKTSTISVTADSATVSFTETTLPNLSILSGDKQSVPSGTFAASTLAVQFFTNAGARWTGQPITFSLPSGSTGGLATTSSGTTSSSVTVNTDAQGLATVYYQAGTDPLKTNSIVASEASTGTNQTVTFTASCGAPQNLVAWSDYDVGTVGTAGGSVQNTAANSFLVSGSGSGVGSASDSFHLLSRPTVGDAEMIARVGSLVSGDSSTISSYATAGLMMRGNSSNPSADSSAVSAYVAVSPDNGLTFTTRDSTGATSSTSLGASVAAPVWLRIVRSTTSVTPPNGTATPGNYAVAGYYSTDGTNWILVGTHAMQMPNSIQLGMAVSSQASGNIASATFDNVNNILDAPQRIANLVGWYRADFGVVSNGGAVSVWQDQSGKGNNAAQSTLANQPSLVPYILNGKPVVHFSNANSTWLSIPSSNQLSPSNLTVIAVARQNGSATGVVVDKYDKTTGGFGLQLVGPANPTFYVNGISDTGTLAAGNYGVLEGVYDQSKLSLYVNGVQTNFTYASTIGANTTPLTIGGTSLAHRCLDGEIAEILIYNAVLTDAQRHQIEGYLYEKYNVGVAPMAATAPSIANSIQQGISSGPQTVTINPGDSGQTIYYTTDGSTPTMSSQLYTGPITLSASATVKAIAYEKGFAASPVISFAYTIDPTASFNRSELVAWYRADAGITSVTGTISRWQDQSGNGNDLTQSTTANQPSLVASDVNSQPAVQFAQAANTSLAAPPAAALNLASGATVIAVVKQTSTNSGKVLDKSTSSTGYAIQFSGSTTPSFSVNGTSNAGSLTNGVYGIVEGLYDGSNLSLYTNGTLTQTATTGAIGNNTQPFTVGNNAAKSAALDGNIAEILVFDHPLTGLDRLHLEAYLYQRYNVGTPPLAPAPTLIDAGVPFVSSIYSGAQTISYMPGDANQVVYYTTDGSTPTSSSSVWTGSITVSSSETIKAIAYSSGYAPSPVVSVTCTIDPLADFNRAQLVSWYRADTGVTTSGGAVSQWRDQSRNGNDVVQLVSGNQPVLVSNSINSQPALQFTNATNTYLSAVASSSLNLSQGATVVAVVQQTGSGSGIIVDKSPTSSSGYTLCLTGSYTATFGVNNATTSGTLTNGTYGILEGYYDRVNLALSVSGTQTQTAYTTAIGANSQPLTLGGAATSGNGLDGNIAEILVFNQPLTGLDRLHLEEYLYQRYGIGSAPATPAPTITNAGAPINSGIYSGLTITFTPGDDGQTIYYTMDGTTPTTSSSVASGAININTNGSGIIRAIAFRSGYAASAVTSVSYTVDTNATFSRAGLLGWYRADTGVTSTSGAISRWQDQSGNGNDAVQNTSGNQPTLATNDVNSQPAVQFTRSSNTYLSIANNSSLNPGQMTVIAVAKQTGTNSGILLDKSPTSSTGYALRFVGSAAPTLFVDNASNTGALTNNTYGVLEGIYDSSNLSLYVNGTLTQAAFTNGVGANSQPITLGGAATAGSGLDGNVAEVLVFNHALSAWERLHVEEYLYQRYGIGPQPAALPPTLVRATALGGSASLTSGIYSSALSVTINPGDTGQTIYYTTDGSTPTSSSTAYIGPFTVSSTQTIKAIAYQSGYAASQVVTVACTIDANATFNQSGLVAWYRADAGITASGGTIGKWQDQSGNGNDAVQATTANQPSLITSSVNGKPAVSFNHTNSNYFTVANSAQLNPSQITIVAVAKQTSTNPGTILDKGQTSTSGYGLHFNSSASPTVYVNGTSQTGTLTNNTYGILEGVYDQSSLSLYVSGTLTQTAYTSAIGSNTQALTIGLMNSTANYLDGSIAEVLIFQSPLSTADRKHLEAYLYQRYAIGTKPVAISPSFSLAQGTYTSTQTVTIIPGETGQSIYYTTDGSTPTSSSTAYTAPITVASTTTIKAIAYETGENPSAVVSATYTIDPTTNFTRSGLVAWYRSDIGVISASGTVSRWQDQSGLGNDVIQNTTAKRPAIVSNVLNGQPVLRFNSASSTFLGVANNPTLDPSQLSIIVVAKSTSTNAYSVAVDKYSQYDLGISTGTTPGLYVNAHAGSVTGAAMASASFAVTEGYYDRLLLSLYVNGTLTQSGPYATPMTASGAQFDIGARGSSGTNAWDGDIAEVLVYSQKISDQDRQAIEYYLANRYHITVTLLDPPTFSVGGGSLTAPGQVAINAPTGAIIYYTTDGSTPTSSSQVYTGPISVNSSETIKAISYQNGYVTSGVSSVSYTLDPTLYPGLTNDASDHTPPTITLELPTNATLLP